MKSLQNLSLTKKKNEETKESNEKEFNDLNKKKESEKIFLKLLGSLSTNSNATTFEEVEYRTRQITSTIDSFEKSYRENCKFRLDKNKLHYLFAQDQFEIKSSDHELEKLMELAKEEIKSLREKSETDLELKAKREKEHQEKLNGPSVFKHFTSLFGDALLVHMIAKNLMAVFCNQGTVEFWLVNFENQSYSPKLINFLEFGEGEVTSVLNLTESFEPPQQMPVDQADKSETKSNPSKQSSAKSKAKSTFDFEEFDDNSSDNSDIMDEVTIPELQNYFMEDPTIECEQEINSKFNKGYFFIGLKSGDGIILEISSTKNVEQLAEFEPEITLKKKLKKKLSSKEIKIVNFDKKQNLILVIIFHPKFDFQLQFLNFFNLEIVFYSNVNFLLNLAKDNQSKVIEFSENGFNFEEKDFVDFSRSYPPLNDCPITILHYDEYNAQILAVLNYGAVLRLTHDVFVVQPDKSVDNEDLDIPDADSDLVRCYHASVLLEVKSLNFEQFERDKLKKDSLVQVMTITTAYNEQKKKPQLFLGCKDGTLRSYQFDSLLNNENKPVKIFEWEEHSFKTKENLVKHDKVLDMNFLQNETQKKFGKFEKGNNRFEAENNNNSNLNQNIALQDFEKNLKIFESKLEFPYWIEILTLDQLNVNSNPNLGESPMQHNPNQFLICLTEEASIYIFDLNFSTPLNEIRLLNGKFKLSTNVEPKILKFFLNSFNKFDVPNGAGSNLLSNSNSLAIILGKEWLIFKVLNVQNLKENLEKLKENEKNRAKSGKQVV
ncbi:hypothetical protein HK099_003503 [Clydaea vesicula]|uniref:Uncharacterized protein n=1 Tax=Clydaea vesicula TaxID=447962 RepID=A0AAD5XYU2_9FUNG|nr:hypothetical protein HK099_003503 [Clydaea vesicula]